MGIPTYHIDVDFGPRDVVRVAKLNQRIARTVLDPLSFAILAETWPLWRPKLVVSWYTCIINGSRVEENQRKLGVKHYLRILIVHLVPRSETDQSDECH